MDKKTEKPKVTKKITPELQTFAVKFQTLDKYNPVTRTVTVDTYGTALEAEKIVADEFGGRYTESLANINAGRNGTPRSIRVLDCKIVKKEKAKNGKTRKLVNNHGKK